MQQTPTSDRSLLIQAAKLGDMLFWRYNCVLKHIEIYNYLPAYTGEGAKKLGPEEEISLHIASVLSKQQDILRDIIYGRSAEKEGTYSYQVSVQEKSYYYKCRYSQTTENGHEIVIGTITDETDKVNIEKRIREKESIFEHLTLYSNLGIFSWNPITGQSYQNSRWYENFCLPQGLSYKESMQLFNDKIHPGDKDRLKKSTDELRRKEKEYIEEVFRIIDNDKIKWVKYTAITKTYDIAQMDIQVIGFNQDITINKVQEEHNQKILETLPDFMFIFDIHFNICDLLKSDSIQLLHPVEQLIGSNGREIFSEEVSSLYEETINKCLAENKLQEIEYYLDAGGKRYYYQARMVPFEDNKVMALIHDIGERVQRTQELVEAKQQAEEADKMKSAFLANMSHEIRTPLNAIVGFSELLTEVDDSSDKELYINMIRTNSQLLLQLVNDILDLSRIESGKTEMLMAYTELTSLLTEVENVERLKLKGNVRLLKESPAEEVWVTTDRNRVMQVLFNFTSNAIKNTQSGSITIKLTRELNQVHLSVIDTGRGIPADKLPVIFDRFVKGNDFVQGTGLGLSICKTIAEKLGGDIKVTSCYGEGSTFSLILPC